MIARAPGQIDKCASKSMIGVDKTDEEVIDFY